MINKTPLVTENIRISITCSPPIPSINIVHAYYGTPNCKICNCTRMDLTHNVTLYCANSGTLSFCTLYTVHAIFGDTCNSVAKTFWLAYCCY
jgi:hypothetical protein